MIQYPEFKPAEVLKHEQMSTGIPPLDRLLAGGLVVGMTHLFCGDSQINEHLLRFAAEAQLPSFEGQLESPTIIVHSCSRI
jgi:predicted ATP-dependent serine protease